MMHSRTLKALMLAPALLAGAAVMAACEEDLGEPAPPPANGPADPAPQQEPAPQPEPADEMDDLDDLLGD